MERVLPYDITYSQLKKWRSYENWGLYISMGCTIIKAILVYFDCKIGISFFQFISFFSLIIYGLLYCVVEIFLQPRVTTERQKGLLDNSLGTKLLVNNIEGYYDNENMQLGPKKLLANTFENCFFTYSIMKKMLPSIAVINIVFFLILLFFAYFGFKDNDIAIALLQLFLSTLFIRRLMHHISFCLRLREIQDQIISLFSTESTNDDDFQNWGYYYTLMYETALAYNKAPNSDQVYEKNKDELDNKWIKMKERYGL